ncbi:hypothetical protein EAH74_29855 [Pseudomonas mandelii]|uniref:Uncharacterized protein n=1 Tax=Pseudomonas mandelii TaxID=75612 RepID=A0A502HMS3_9PSED|nr:hypothetical protein EAH74_29855 [Pseudomonas mandelii]
MAVAQSKTLSPDTPLSRAGSLPHWFYVVRKICGRHRTLWERACSRWRWPSQKHCRLTHRFREQARSHIGSMLFARFVADTGPCGSEPARDGGGTVKKYCRLIHRFREQARSHIGFMLFARFVADTGPCGSEPAREGGGPVNNTVA